MHANADLSMRGQGCEGDKDHPTMGGAMQVGRLRRRVQPDASHDAAYACLKAE